MKNPKSTHLFFALFLITIILLALIGLSGCTAVARGETPTPAQLAISEEQPSPQSPPVAQGAAYYIRPDGGSTTQCTGTADAPYPGSGSNQPCAWPARGR